MTGKPLEAFGVKATPLRTNPAADPPPKRTSVVKPTILDLARLAHKQFPDEIEYLTPNWESTLKAFYGMPLTDADIDRMCKVNHRGREYWEARRAGGAPFRELWARVGRRGRKSATIGLVCAYEALYGGHEPKLMRGENGRIMVLSRDKEGAAIVAAFTKNFCDALNVETKRTTIGGAEARELVEIDGSRFYVAIMPSNKRATRGTAAPVVVLDEFAFLGTEESESANSDKEILAAAKPAMSQFKETSKLLVISSPLGEVGEFHKHVENNIGLEGDPKYRSERILAVEGPSWEWNPGVSEEETHELERDPDIHAREYGAKPSGAEGVAFDRKDVRASFKSREGVWEWGRPFMVVDASGGGNTFACAIVECGRPTSIRSVKKYRTPDGTPVVERDEYGNPVYEAIANVPITHIVKAFGFTGPEIKKLGMQAVIDQIALEAKYSGCAYIFGDQYGAAFLRPLFTAKAIDFKHFSHTVNSKHEAVLTLRWLMREGQLWVEPHERLEADLVQYPRRVSGSKFIYGYPPTRGYHNDYGSALITMGHVFNAISEAGGSHGLDSAGETFTIQYAPTRFGVGRKDTGAGWG